MTGAWPFLMNGQTNERHGQDWEWRHDRRVVSNDHMTVPAFVCNSHMAKTLLTRASWNRLSTLDLAIQPFVTAMRLLYERLAIDQRSCHESCNDGQTAVNGLWLCTCLSSSTLDLCNLHCPTAIDHVNVVKAYGRTVERIQLKVDDEKTYKLL